MDKIKYVNEYRQLPKQGSYDGEIYCVRYAPDMCLYTWKDNQWKRWHTYSIKRMQYPPYFVSNKTEVPDTGHYIGETYMLKMLYRYPDKPCAWRWCGLNIGWIEGYIKPDNPYEIIWKFTPI